MAIRSGEFRRQRIRTPADSNASEFTDASELRRPRTPNSTERNEISGSSRMRIALFSSELFLGRIEITTQAGLAWISELVRGGFEESKLIGGRFEAVLELV